MTGTLTVTREGFGIELRRGPSTSWSTVETSGLSKHTG